MEGIQSLLAHRSKPNNLLFLGTLRYVNYQITNNFEPKMVFKLNYIVLLCTKCNDLEQLIKGTFSVFFTRNTRLRSPLRNARGAYAIGERFDVHLLPDLRSPTDPPRP